MVETTIQQVQKLPCPKCDRLDSVFFSGQLEGKQRFMCRVCNYAFTTSHGISIPYIPRTQKPKITKITNEKKQPCPECHKIDDVKFHGHKGERRIFKCKACNRTYVFPYINPTQRIGKRVYGRTVEHVIELPFLDCANLLKRFNRPLITFDSIINVPCFGCDIRPCYVTQCDKMEIWLM